VIRSAGFRDKDFCPLECDERKGWSAEGGHCAWPSANAPARTRFAPSASASRQTCRAGPEGCLPH